MNSTPPPAPIRSDIRQVANALALAALLGGVLCLALLWNVLPDRLPLRLNLASPAEWGGKTRLLIFPVIAAVLYLLLTQAERRGVLNLPDLGTPDRNVRAAQHTAAALKALSVTLVMVGQTAVLRSAPAVPVHLWLLFGGLMAGLFLLIYRRPVNPKS